jgi:twitching motility protein PilT
MDSMGEIASKLLHLAMEMGASDVHAKVGSPPHVRIHGVLSPMPKFQRLSSTDTELLANDVMNEGQRKIFQEKLEIDIGYGIPGLGRFRINIFHQRGTITLSIRAIPLRIPVFEELYLPPVLAKIAAEQRGLVLVTGTTGSGKSTTLASMLDYINNTEAMNIITIEDPIEFLHRDNKSLISQREISVDTHSFSNSLRSALRQDPDIILVGEMRDQETIETALLAAETGHLVFSTLHTTDAIETINRVIAVFPPHQQDQIRIQLASVLSSIISMRLIGRSDKSGRVPAVEVLRSTEFIRSLILDPMKTKQIRGAIEAGTSQYGMQSFDQSIFQHYQKGLISFNDALSYATSPDEFKLRVQGVYSTSGSAREELEKDMLIQRGMSDIMETPKEESRLEELRKKIKAR